MALLRVLLAFKWTVLLKVGSPKLMLWLLWSLFKNYALDCLLGAKLRWLLLLLKFNNVLRKKSGQKKKDNEFQLQRSVYFEQLVSICCKVVVNFCMSGNRNCLVTVKHTLSLVRWKQHIQFHIPCFKKDISKSEWD